MCVCVCLDGSAAADDDARVVEAEPGRRLAVRVGDELDGDEVAGRHRQIGGQVGAAVATEARRTDAVTVE